MNMEQLQGPGITCANLQLHRDRAVTATGERQVLASRAVHRESTQCYPGTRTHCSWWPANTEGCKIGKEPAGGVEFALHIFGSLGLRYPE